MLVSTRGLADANIASMLSNLTVGIAPGETLDEAYAWLSNALPTVPRIPTVYSVYVNTTLYSPRFRRLCRRRRPRRQLIHPITKQPRHLRT